MRSARLSGKSGARPPSLLVWPRRQGHQMSRILAAVTTAVIAAAISGAAHAEPTEVIVRALSKDAKFIGDSMGGVQVTLTDAATGHELAKGLITGTTGDTQKIMIAPRQRGVAISTPEAAAFRTTLDLDRPTLVRVEAVGPLGKPASQITVTSMKWLAPGQSLTGDGWVLEFPGLVIEPAVAVQAAGLKVNAKVTLMCGCPIEPGGLWDADKYQVSASLIAGGETLASTSLSYAGKPSTFAAELPKPKAGGYRLRVVATNPETGNTGVVEQPIVIER